MAEEGEGAKIAGTIAGQSVSFTTSNPLVLIVVLLIVGIIVGGFVAWFQLDKRVDTSWTAANQRIDATWQHVDRRLTALEQQHTKFFEMLQGNRESTHDDIQRLLKNLTILQYNIQHPDAEIPLGINGTPPPKPPTP